MQRLALGDYITSVLQNMEHFLQFVHLNVQSPRRLILTSTVMQSCYWYIIAQYIQTCSIRANGSPCYQGKKATTVSQQKGDHNVWLKGSLPYQSKRATAVSEQKGHYSIRVKETLYCLLIKMIISIMSI